MLKLFKLANQKPAHLPHLTPAHTCTHIRTHPAPGQEITVTALALSFPGSLCFLTDGQRFLLWGLPLSKALWISQKILKIVFNWRMLTILWRPLPSISMNQSWVYICALPRQPASYLPPHSTPPGRPGTPALGSLCWTAGLPPVAHVVN